jgi:hypothetical protein
MKPTIEQADAYQKAFDILNNELFDGIVNAPMLVLTRNTKVIGGYLATDRWENEDGDTVCELAINANVMAEGDLPTVMGILVHEMVHLWQYQYGAVSRNGYHNKEWVDKCDDIGLCITNSDGKNGTGQAVETGLAKGGAAIRVIASIPPEELFPWLAHEIGDMDPKDKDQGKEQQEQTPPPKVKPGSRTKYTCPICGLNAWAKKGASLMCGDCSIALVGQV